MISSFYNCGLYGVQLATVQPAYRNRSARNWRTKFYNVHLEIKDGVYKQKTSFIR